MFHGLIALLTVVAMLTHAFLGCCVQHWSGGGCAEAGRPAETCMAESSPAEISRASSCRHAHHEHRGSAHVEEAHGQAAGEKPSHAGTHAPQPADEHAPHSHEEGRCAFVLSMKVVAPVVGARLVLDDALATAGTHALSVAASLEREAALSSTGLPPDRHVRDVTQVWLL